MARTRRFPVPAVPIERVQQRILVLRGQRVLLDSHLAALYAVEVRTLLQAVRRNAERFPADFMFRLTRDEWASLRSQIVILDAGRGRHRKYLPFAFTEQGVAMLSSVLRSPRAVLVNVAIMRAFVRLRRLIESDGRLARRLAALERRMREHDQRFGIVFDAIRRLLEPPPVAPRGRIGFGRGGRSEPAERRSARATSHPPVLTTRAGRDLRRGRGHRHRRNRAGRRASGAGRAAGRLARLDHPA